MLLVSPLAHVSQKQPRPFDEDCCSHMERSPGPVATENVLRCSGDIEISLNIYDVTHDNVLHHINEFFANSMSPLKLGGVFHVGIQIMDGEWAYGWARSGTGVTCGKPRSEQQHRFRETVSLARTKLSLTEVDNILRSLIGEYRGRDYNMTEKNCCHFAEDLCQRLGVGSLPAWVHRLGRAYDSLQKATKSLGSLSAGPSLGCYSLGPGEGIASQDKCRRRSSKCICRTFPMQDISNAGDPAGRQMQEITRSKNTQKEILCM